MSVGPGCSFDSRVRSSIHTYVAKHIGAVAQTDELCEMMCLQLHYAMLGEACMTPGLSTFITELGHSVSGKQQYEKLTQEFYSLGRPVRHDEGDPMCSWRRRKLQDDKTRIAMASVYAKQSSNSLFCTQLHTDAKLCPNLHTIVGSTFGIAVYKALAFGITLIAVKLNDNGRCGPSITNYKSKWRNTWIRDVFGSQHLDGRGSQPKHVSNPA